MRPVCCRNPEILNKKWLIPTISACLSLRGVYLIMAYQWIKVRYQDLKGNHNERIFKGRMAVVLQQEIDHINGKLIRD